MLHAAAGKIRASSARLSQLDSAIGDGDHGTTMLRAMGLMEKVIAGAPRSDIGVMLTDVGWAFMGVDGGAIGPLLGTLALGMAESVPQKAALDAAGFAAMFEAGLAAVQKQTKAQVGDKTLIDALVPAVAALRASVSAGETAAAAMKKAAEAAEAGAESTVPMRARFGRARNLGDRAIGSPDPGATSISLIFRGMADALA
jgi:dihydroxyacetone kinase-like protein